MSDRSDGQPGDYLVRAISDETNVRALACVATGLVEEARRLHGTSPTVTTALGRALSAGALMGALLKRNQRMGLKFEGDGPMKKVIVEADSDGMLRGSVGVTRVDEPEEGGPLAVARALGSEGYLTVMRDEGQNEPYRGVVRLRTGEIAEDLAAYYVISEQIPTAVGLGVFVEPDESVRAAGGFLVQSLPGADEERLGALNDVLEALPPVTTLFRSGKSPEEILGLIFEDVGFRVLETRQLALRCSCNRERIERVLMALGPAELERLIREEGEASVTCEFCLGNYYFTGKELEQVRNEALGKAPGEQEPFKGQDKR